MTDDQWFWWFYAIWEQINLSGWQQLPRYIYTIFYPGY